MRKLGIVIAIVVALLALYPAMELTRCILVHGIELIMEANSAGVTIIWDTSWSPTLNTFYTELSLIWGFWLAIPVVVYVAIQAAYKGGRRE